MNFIIFFTGFILGIIFTVIPVIIINRQSKSANDNTIEQMKLYFENTANKVFQDNSARFSEQNAEKLEEYFKRFRDKLEVYEKQNEEKFKTEADNFLRFDMNIKQFIEAGSKISQDTSNLVRIMKTDNRSQGLWGEIVLEKVLENSGLRKGEEYTLQTGNSEGIPDATILLPENRCVYVDAKTSLSSWSGYVEAQSDDEKEEFLKKFIASTKSHISGLSKKDYSASGNSPDYVLMFIPIESCYSLMFCENCELWEYAWANKIMPVSPSTLLAALKIINAFYVMDKQNKNAVEISRLCTGMLDKFASLLTELLKIRNLLDSSLKKLQGKGNILTQIEKLENLGAVITKDFPELPEFEEDIQQ